MSAAKDGAVAGVDQCWIQTFTGAAFNLAEPRPEHVRLGDIAWALARICRYTGHSIEHTSVALHSVRVAREVWHRTRGDRSAALAALVHDAAEAYVGDVSRPLKLAMRRRGGDVYAEIDRQVERVIAERFELVPQSSETIALIHHCDTLDLAAEREEVMGPPPPEWGRPTREPYWPTVLTRRDVMTAHGSFALWSALEFLTCAEQFADGPMRREATRLIHYALTIPLSPRGLQRAWSDYYAQRDAVAFSTEVQP